MAFIGIFTWNKQEMHDLKRILGANHLTFEKGGGVILKINSCKAILNKKKYLH